MADNCHPLLASLPVSLLGFSSLWAERIFERFEHPSLQIEVSQIIVHKAHQPDIVLHFFDAHGLTGKDLTEINFLATQTDAATVGHDNDFVVERIINMGW